MVCRETFTVPYYTNVIRGMTAVQSALEMSGLTVYQGTSDIDKPGTINLIVVGNMSRVDMEAALLLSLYKLI